jgi:hypothetical protein
LKNTHEILGPLHHATAHMRLTRFEFLDGPGTLRRSTFGSGAEAVVVTVNAGSAEAAVRSELLGQLALPPNGFVVEAPVFAAWYARQVGARREELRGRRHRRPDGRLQVGGVLAAQHERSVALDEAAVRLRARERPVHEREVLHRRGPALESREEEPVERGQQLPP